MQFVQIRELHIHGAQELVSFIILVAEVTEGSRESQQVLEVFLLFKCATHS